MKTYTFDDWNIAEFIYHFCEDDTIYADFEKHCHSEDLSLAEYVLKYRFDSFRKWIFAEYQIIVLPPIEE